MTILRVGGGGTKTQVSGVVSLAASGIVLAGVAGKKLKCYCYSIQSRNDGMTVQLTDGNGGANLTHVWTFNAREGTVPPATVPETFIFATSQGNAIFAVVTGAGMVDIDVRCWNDDVS